MTQHYTRIEIETILSQMKAKRQHFIDHDQNVDIRFIEEGIQAFEQALKEVNES